MTNPDCSDFHVESDELQHFEYIGSMQEISESDLLVTESVIGTDEAHSLGLLGGLNASCAVPEAQDVLSVVDSVRLGHIAELHVNAKQPTISTLHCARIDLRELWDVLLVRPCKARRRAARVTP